MIVDPKSEEAAFIREIAREPDDDAPRLIFADWLEEQGDLRAEFIRVQCEMERTAWHEERWWQLYEHEQALISEHAEQWLTQFPRHRGVTWGLPPTVVSRELQIDRIVFRRGLPEAGTGEVARAAMRENGTLLREVQTRLDDDFSWLRGIRGLSALQADNAWRRLIRSQYVAGLERLDLWGARLADRGLQELCDSPYLRDLQFLQLEFNGLTATGLGHLLRWPGLTSLLGLNLSNNHLENAEAMFADPRFGQLHLLDLSLNHLTDRVIEVLANARHLDRLTHLSLANNPGLSDAALARLLASEALPSLRVLSLSGTGAGNQTLQALAASGRRLHTLLLASSHLFGALQFSTAALKELANSPALEELRRLSVRGTRVSFLAAVALAKSPYLTKLRYLNIGGSGLTEGGIARLRKRFGVEAVAETAGP